MSYSDEGTGRSRSPPRPPPRCTKYNSPPINGQSTNFVLFDVALVESEGLTTDIVSVICMSQNDQIIWSLTASKLIVTATRVDIRSDTVGALRLTVNIIRRQYSAISLLGAWLLGDVVARKRADTAGATVYTDAPPVVIATHHRDKISFTQLELVDVTRHVVVQDAVPVQRHSQLQ